MMVAIHKYTDKMKRAEQVVVHLPALSTTCLLKKGNVMAAPIVRKSGGKSNRPINSSTSTVVLNSVPEGTVFERLTTAGPVFLLSVNQKPQRFVVAVCNCGTIGAHKLSALLYGHTKSCGCLWRERTKGHKPKHGLDRKGNRHPTLNTYAGMKSRCYNPKSRAYKDYGGRGISICHEWLGDFMEFHRWSIANGWAPGLSLDRINNNGNYEPGNCRWTGRLQQANNSRKNRHITAFGETKTLSEWARDARCCVDLSALRFRLRNGWESEVAISSPPRAQKRGGMKVEDAAILVMREHGLDAVSCMNRDVLLQIAELAEMTGGKPGTVANRVLDMLESRSGFSVSLSQLIHGCNQKHRVIHKPES